ncbi:Mu transposase C-terminal domain-containing protein [Oceanobacter kriegii]|uniref:Mu transposase C-terminal domain-containing protein n=1 Tax=Oceanobacter kriegii TaxID=64972 RepID=UPI00041BBEA3|nr:Mu transposase C-terminal domain-containing protein [Oceanobacter kriegii]
MNDWFTPKDLAGISGLPGTERAIQIKAKAESWQSRPKAVGKGNEYHISNLPAESQRALRISMAKKAAAASRANPVLLDDDNAKAAAQLQREQALNRYKKLSDGQKKKVDAKLAILHAAQEFHRASGLPKGKAYTEFSTLYKAEEIAVEAWVREIEPKCSRPSLYLWEKKINDSGIDALAGDTGKGRRGTGVIDSQPALREYIVGMVVDRPHIKITTLVKALRAEFAGTEVTLPSERRLAEWISKWKSDNRAVFTAVTNPDAWKNKYMDAQGSASEHVHALNQLWEFDSTPADLMLTDGRHSILGAIDVYSRRTLFVVMPTSNSKGVAQVIRRCLLSWGVPETAKTDNGADYKSKYIQQVFRSLGVEQEFCPPFQGWKKPHIERVFKTFSHDIAELLPGYIGHNITERQAIESRRSFSDRLFQKDELIEVKMSSAELQQFCNDWLEHEYHPRRHSSLGESPAARVASYAGNIRTINDERLLDVLLSEPAGTRTITKKGLKIDGGIYIHAELAAHTGEQVNVFYDEADMGRVYVYSIDGDYLCTAEDPEITGISREEVGTKAKAIQKEAIQEERRRLKAAARKVTKRDVAQQILEHRAAEERAEKVRHFPRPEQEHTSAGIEAAKAALTAQQPAADLPALPVTEAPAKPAAQVIRPEFKAPAITPPTDYAERYLFALDISQRIDDGEATEAEANWFNRFKNSSAFKTGRDLHQMRTGGLPLTGRK